MAKFRFFAITATILLFSLQDLVANSKHSSRVPPKASHFQLNSTPLKTKALIYKGEGSCIDHCSESAALIAEMAGLEPIYVTPDETNFDIFADAAIWIQPGGESLVVAANMSEDLKIALREFVAEGGGYVGFCAGAFFADLWIHGTDSRGLGIIAAKAIDYDQAPAKAAMLDLVWNGQNRTVYWEEGPYFEPFFQGQIFTPFAYYPTGEIASMYGKFFKGRVSVTGLHPEAPQYWRDDIFAADADGLDYDLALDMVLWAAKRTRDINSQQSSAH